MRLLTKIDEAARNYWRTKDPKFKKEWYRLCRVFANIVKRKNLELFGEGVTVVLNPGKNV